MIEHGIPTHHLRRFALAATRIEWELQNELLPALIREQAVLWRGFLDQLPGQAIKSGVERPGPMCFRESHVTLWIDG